MSTGKILRVKSSASEETERIGANVARVLRGGETIELRSDLGGGKTTFVKGLVKGLGAEGQVASPSFTIAREYTTRQYRVVHFDFYRVSDPGIVTHSLQEAMLDEATICCIEWADSVTSVLPRDRIIVTITKDPSIESKRVIAIEASPRYMARLRKALT